jgi:hypothetical protein
MTRILTLSEWNKNYCFQRRISKPAINKLAPSAENITIMRVLQDQMNFKVLLLICYLSFKQSFTNKLFFVVVTAGISSWCLGTLCLGECLDLREETIGGRKTFPMQWYSNFYSLPDYFLVDK